jgi:hypothetical protein
MNLKRSLPVFLLLLMFQLTFAQEYPVQITDEGYIIVEVKLADSIKANFILDTGAGAIVLSGKSFEKIKDKAESSGYFTGFRNDGDRVDGEIYRIPSLAIGDVIQKDVLIGIYPPLDDYGVDGLVSLKFFEDKPFTIDFKNKKIRFIKNGDDKYGDNKFTALPITIHTNMDFSLDMFIRVCLNGGVSVNAEFDTGSGYNTLLVNPYFIKKLGLDQTEITSRKYTTPISGNELNEYVYTSNSVNVCSEINSTHGKTFSQIPVVFREGLIYEALIGSFLFKDGSITIDIPGRRIIIEN